MNKLTFYAPISKTDDEERMVYGYASTEALDSQGEVVKKDAVASAIDDYMKFANIREMHQPSAVGKAKEAKVDGKGLYLAAKVVDDKAWEKVKEGVYNGFSIGGRVKTMIGNEITGLTLSEISLVDRPANPEAVFDVWKMDGDKPEEPMKTEVKKSLYDVQALAQVIQNLHYVEEMVEGDGVWEDDEKDKEFAGKLNAQVKSLGELLVERTQRETEELTAEEKPANEPMEMADTKEDVKKADTEVAETVKESDTVTEEKPAEALKSDEPAVAGPPKPETEEVKATETVVTEKSAEITAVEEAIIKGEMPTDDQIVALLKAQSMETDEKTVGAFKLKCADAIVANIEMLRKEQFDKDAVLNDLNKKLDAVSEEVKKESVNGFEKVAELVDSLAKEISAEAEAEKPAEAPIEEKIEAKADMPDMQKMDAAIAKAERLEKENTDLKARIEKLESMPLEVKAKVVYQTVEKGQESVEDALAKAETKLDEYSKLIQSGKADQATMKKAADQANKVMELRRQIKVHAN